MRVLKWLGVVSLGGCLVVEGAVHRQSPVAPQDASNEIAAALRSGFSEFTAKHKTSITESSPRPLAETQSLQTLRSSDALDSFNTAYRQTLLHAAGLATSTTSSSTTTTKIMADITEGAKFLGQESSSEAFQAASPIVAIAPQHHSSLFDHPFIRRLQPSALSENQPLEHCKHCSVSAMQKQVQEQQKEKERELEEQVAEIEDHRYQQALQYFEQEHVQQMNIEFASTTTTTKDRTFSNVEYILSSGITTTTTIATLPIYLLPTTTTTTITMVTPIIPISTTSTITTSGTTTATTTATTTRTTTVTTTITTSTTAMASGTQTPLSSMHLTSLTKVPTHPVGLSLSTDQANVLDRLAKLPVLLSLKGRDQRMKR